MRVGRLQAVTPRHQPTVFITHSICIHTYIYIYMYICIYIYIYINIILYQILNCCETWETQLIAAYQGDSQKGRIAVLGENLARWT